MAIVLTVSPAPASSLAGKTICLDPGHGGTAATDSYRVVARDCHLRRVQLLELLGQSAAGAAEQRRAEEWYVPLDQ